MTLLVLERAIFFIQDLLCAKEKFFFLVHLSVVSKSFSSLGLYVNSFLCRICMHFNVIIFRRQADS